jgi:import inner membrane translocase subunit TIM50
VLDLDDTLIHTQSDPFLPLLSQSTKLKTGEFLIKRPGLNSFLAYAAENFEMFIFTYADREYAEPIVRIIAPFLPTSHILYRDSCFLRNGKVYKDLDMLDRDMRNVVFVDDNKGTTAFYPKNSILIPTWKGSPIDTILTRNLPEVLEECHRTDNVQKVLPRLAGRIRKWR